MDLSQQEWKERLEADTNSVIIDVRNDLELEEGFIPQAIQIDIQNPAVFMEKIKTLSPDKSYYIYCRSGGRSGQACMILNSLGIKNTYNLIGGFDAWEGAVEHP